MIRKLFFFGVVVLSIAFVAGCGGGNTYGKQIDQKLPVVSIQELNSNPSVHEDKEVVVEGTITSECPAGGWYFVKDKSGAEVYVDLHHINLAIPQIVGRRVKTVGKFIKTEDETYRIAGMGVEEL